MIEEIAARHEMRWEDGEAPYQALIDAGEFTNGTVKKLALDTIRQATIHAVKTYREAPPPPPSRISRDYVEPAVKAAAKLSAQLENEHAQALLSSVFASHADAQAFMESLRRIGDVERVDAQEHSKRRVEQIAEEVGITLSDPIEHLRSSFGEHAVVEYRTALATVDHLNNKHRVDPIRFDLACEIVRALSSGFGLYASIAENKNVKRQALAEIVTLMVEAVGTFEGAPKPTEDYFAKTITKEAIEYISAEMAFADVNDRYEM
jgi:hypothetical protein